MRIALILSYCGKAYYGWQKQANCPSIQAELEQALSTIANEPIEVFVAGRTDKGVHAIQQVLHFDTTHERSHFTWIEGTNALLPKDIRISSAHNVDETFHARYSAHSRSYLYIINNHRLSSAFFSDLQTQIKYPLAENLMQQAANYLIGEQDFTSFRDSECQAKSAFRRIEGIRIARRGDWVLAEITANAFLHHMVRNIMGSLIQVGAKEKPVKWIESVLNARDRRLAGPTAPAAGLYLLSVKYPAQYNLPESAVPADLNYLLGHHELDKKNLSV